MNKKRTCISTRKSKKPFNIFWVQSKDLKYDKFVFSFFVTKLYLIAIYHCGVEESRLKRASGKVQVEQPQHFVHPLLLFVSTFKVLYSRFSLIYQKFDIITLPPPSSGSLSLSSPSTSLSSPSLALPPSLSLPLSSSARVAYVFVATHGSAVHFQLEKMIPCKFRLLSDGQFSSHSTIIQ